MQDNQSIFQGPNYNYQSDEEKYYLTNSEHTSIYLSQPQISPDQPRPNSMQVTKQKREDNKKKKAQDGHKCVNCQKQFISKKDYNSHKRACQDTQNNEQTRRSKAGRPKSIKKQQPLVPLELLEKRLCDNDRLPVQQDRLLFDFQKIQLLLIQNINMIKSIIIEVGELERFRRKDQPHLFIAHTDQYGQHQLNIDPGYYYNNLIDQRTDTSLQGETRILKFKEIITAVFPLLNNNALILFWDIFELIYQQISVKEVFADNESATLIESILNVIQNRQYACIPKSFESMRKSAYRFQSPQPYNSNYNLMDLNNKDLTALLTVITESTIAHCYNQKNLAASYWGE